MNESNKIVYKQKFKLRYESFVRSVSIDINQLKETVSTFYSAQGLNLPDIHDLSEFFIKQLTFFIKSNLKVLKHTKSSIKLLDFWVYYIPEGNDKAQILASDRHMTDFLTPDKYYVGMSCPEYGYEQEAELKKADDSFSKSFSNAALYSDAMSLYKENDQLKRKIAWLEKSIILKPF